MLSIIHKLPFARNCYFWLVYTLGKGLDEHSLNDDLEILFKKLKLGQVTDEKVQTFSFPKLTNKEMELVESKDEDHLASYGASPVDIDEAEMKLSDSKSKFVHKFCQRETNLCQQVNINELMSYALLEWQSEMAVRNGPINGYFKRSIQGYEKSEDEPRSKIKPL